ncbi:hypothetical protein DCS_00685 [Drechmeria coniospora]|uniref:Integrase catalytic domain-containing protein n=1 Tax=Drechmeria coniospora TaxID=98403 RepID=A0A151GR13_DRECN|nr:hypothetical protein DCS_00685 [Drechmeria coniospora]KYK59555.1 hypothetical protein DCS_00685 [Drechmeria coniospora]
MDSTKEGQATKTPIMSELEAIIQRQQLQYDDLSNRFNQLTEQLNNTIIPIQKRLDKIEPEHTPIQGIPTHSSGTTTTEVTDLSSNIELSKKVFLFPEYAKLKDTKNFDLWEQSLSIQLGSLRLEEFLKNPSIAISYSHHNQCSLLILLRDSCSEGPRASIAWIHNPTDAYLSLKQQYSKGQAAQRCNLYDSYHNLTLKGYKGTLEAFNSEFNSCLTRLQLTGVSIDPLDQANRYLTTVGPVFSQWAAIQRNNLQTNAVLGINTTSLNLQYLQTNLLEEHQNPDSPSFQAFSHRITQLSKTPDNRSTRPSQPNRPNRTNRPNRPKSPDNRPNQPNQPNSPNRPNRPKRYNRTKNYTPDKGTTSFLTGDYSLSTGCMGLPDSCQESDTDSDSEQELVLLPDLGNIGMTYRVDDDDTYRMGLLYDTGSTCHLVNNRLKFTTFRPIAKSQAKPITTGGGPIYPKGIGCAEFTVLIRTNPSVYGTLVLQEALYIPKLEVSIVSGIRHYASGGTLIKEHLYNSNRQLCGLLNFQKHGFFLQQQGQQTPYLTKSDTSHSSYYSSYGIIVEIPSQPPPWATEAEDWSAPSTVPRSAPSTVPRSAPSPVPRSAPSPVPRSAPSPVPRSAPRSVPSPTVSSATPRDLTKATLFKDPIEDPIPIEATDQLVVPTTSLGEQVLPTTCSESNNQSYQRLLQQAGIWHIRLGHISLPLLKKTSSITTGLPDFSTIQAADFQCLACIQAKSTRRQSRDPIDDPDQVLDSIAGDTFGIRPVSYDRKSVGLILIDRKSRFRWVLILPNKEGSTVLQAIRNLFKSLKRQYNCYPKQLFFDEGTEINTLLQTWLGKKGILFDTSCPYTPEQNGLAERSIRVILDRLRATMIWAGLPLFLWSAVLPAIVNLVNYTAISNRDLSPTNY